MLMFIRLIGVIPPRTNLKYTRLPIPLAQGISRGSSEANVSQACVSQHF